MLNLLGNEYVNKLPKSLLNMLEEKRNINYVPKYTDAQPLNKQNIQKETLSIIALLHLNYWCENEEEKKQLRKMFKNNEDKYQRELREKYNPDNMFKNNIQESTIKNEVSLIEYKESIFRKLINKIKSFWYK